MSDKIATARWRHDLKNQLGIILGFSELLLQDLAEEDPQRGDVDEIHKAAQRAMDLMNTLEPAEPTVE